MQKSKHKFPLDHFGNKKLHAITKLYFEFNHLKQIYRTGWLLNKVPEKNCESVAEHSFSVALLALFIAEKHLPHLNTEKLLKMALIHDFGEAYIGDIVTTEKNKKSKSRIELQAIKKIFSKIENGSGYLNLWKEFETQSSDEAIFVRQIDKLEMLMQACIYEHHFELDLRSFFEKNSKDIKNDSLREILGEIEKLRRK